MTEERELQQSPDPSAELSAMQAIADAVGDLPQESKIRVLRWATDLFGVRGSVPHGSNRFSPARQMSVESKAESPIVEISRFGSVADLFAQASPKSDADKALVVSYWLQTVGGQSEVDAQQVNTELKHLGYGVSNITRAFNTLKAARPALVVQTKKGGTTKQARKIFKVTVAGCNKVEEMLPQN